MSTKRKTYSADFKAKLVLKVLEGATQQSQQVTAQKTGMGNSLNITG